jgi:hypothetical protein
MGKRKHIYGSRLRIAAMMVQLKTELIMDFSVALLFPWHVANQTRCTV